MGTPGMIKVNLRTPPEATPKPNPNPKSNDKTDEPKKKPIDAAHTPVSTPAKAIPGANTDLKITGANTDLKTIAKITLDPPITAHPILPAPSPPQHAPHNIQNVPVAASPTLLTITSPVLSQALATSVAPSSTIHDTTCLQETALTYDWENHPCTPANVKPPEIYINKIQRSAHRKKSIISLPTSTLKSRATLDFDAYAYFKGTSTYVPNPTIVHMSDQFIQFLQLLLEILCFQCS